ncbi:MAG: universal stress protein [Nitrosopumilus sp.]|nr:universal stress protein [Nitrosopumilus sp.]
MIILPIDSEIALPWTVQFSGQFQICPENHVGEILLESISDHVTHHANIPVVIVK